MHVSDSLARDHEPLPADAEEPDPAYRAALAWIWSFSAAPHTPAETAAERPYKLARMRALLAALGNPHHTFSSVLVGGTKGKGSTVAMLAACLRPTGRRTGRYTSPHLVNWRERTWVDGRLISADEVVALLPELRAAVEHVPAALGRLTTFEVGTAHTFLHFARAGVEIAAVEVGVGGAFDATNVLDPLVSVVTPISYDHTVTLGGTLTEIARHKAGILRPGQPAVLAPQPPEALAVVLDTARRLGCPVARVGADWTWHDHPGTAELTIVPPATSWSERGETPLQPRSPRAHVIPEAEYPLPEDRNPPASQTPASASSDQPPVRVLRVHLPLLGEHQRDNATAAVAALDALGRLRPDLALSPETLAQGLAEVEWPGRLQVLSTRPLLVVDGAHNGGSAEALAAAVHAHFRPRQVLLVLGATAGKDVDAVLRPLLPGATVLIATRSRHERAEPPHALAARARELRPRILVEVESDLTAALAAARARAGADDLVLITGSLFLVGEALHWWQHHGAGWTTGLLHTAGATP